MAKYVMSDVHGNYKKFRLMLERIDFKEEDTLYILGDVIDRGTKGLSILDYIVSKKNIKLLMGNHEKMMLDAIETGDYFLWYSNGGQVTHSDFLRRDYMFNELLLDYLRKRPLIEVVDDKFILVHAELTFPCDYEKLTLEELLKVQDVEDNIWGRDLIGLNVKYKDYLIISGHTPVQSITNDISTKEIVRSGNNIYIDCGCGYGRGIGNLGCLRLDDMEEFYV